MPTLRQDMCKPQLDASNYSAHLTKSSELEDEG